MTGTDHPFHLLSGGGSFGDLLFECVRDLCLRYRRSVGSCKKGMDLFGVVVAAVLTGIGGGTLRDLCLGVHPVNWVTDSTGLQIAIVFGLLTFTYIRFRQLEHIPIGFSM